MTSTAPQKLSTSAIRQAFIDFFAKHHGHTFAPSSPVVPHDDPTLLFTNAGMNQFKDVFLGQGSRDYNRAVNSQKCIRAGGKHNDLEDVGKDTYHHTFFEMLGNWSFGEYFKEEAIEWAWKLLVDEWGLDPDRLYVTVFEGSEADGTQPDLEAETLWKQFVPEDRISRWGKKENFWEMGATGPCGPCSEIHFDGRTDAERAAVDGTTLVNRDHPDVIEIWNLVFMEFNRSEGGKLAVLPDKHVDTGMGLERVARVLQGKTSNYDTDLWQPVFAAITKQTGARPYSGAMEDPVDIAYRVIADHIRCLSVAITDGARPSNEGRGYVLRRILRRAVRIARQTLNTEGAVLCRLVPSVIETLGDAFPELTKSEAHVTQVIREEEEAFLRTLDRGLIQFDQAAEVAKDKTIAASEAFLLHDTFGFPIDLTRVMAEERGMTVDEAGYETLMEEARERSRSGSSDTAETMSLPPDAIAKLKNQGVGPTLDEDKYHGRPIGADVKAIWNGADFDNRSNLSRTVGIITDRTNFYAEQGGQIGDTGELRIDTDHSVDIARPVQGIGKGVSRGGGLFKIEQTVIIGGYVLHIGAATEGTIRVGDTISMTIDNDRRRLVRANHTATHLLNHGLRAVLGDHVEQRGSHVGPDRLRFDFSHGQAMSADEVAAVQELVDKGIAANHTVWAQLAPLEDAKKIGTLRAVFGEKYPDPVRVVSVGAPIAEMLSDPTNEKWNAHSVEFCGGTHMDATNDIGSFVILSEQGLAAGIRRLTALTGVPAMAAQHAGEELLKRIDESSKLDGEALVTEAADINRNVEELALPLVSRNAIEKALAPMRKRVKAARKQAQAGARDQIVEQARDLAESDDGKVLVHQVLGADNETLRIAMDVFRSVRPDSAVLLVAADHEASKVMIAASVPKETIAQGLKAGDWVKHAATVCGGGGGGRPDMAQAGGRDVEKVDEAVESSRAFAFECLASS